MVNFRVYILIYQILKNIFKTDFIMATNFKYIHIGELIDKRIKELDISVERAAKFVDISGQEVENIHQHKSIDTLLLLRWSKLLKYDFFRIYSQHLILYAPQDKVKSERDKTRKKETSLPILKKNIYTKEVIAYLIEQVQSGRKTSRDIQREYNIPSTTILRWMNKYASDIRLK